MKAERTFYLIYETFNAVTLKLHERLQERKSVN